MSGALAAILDVARITTGVPGVFAPVEVGKTGVGNERVAAGRPCRLMIGRDRDGTSAALDGTIAVWGANLPHPTTGAASNVQAFLATASQTVFDPVVANMPYAAFSNNNWVVRVNGTWLTRKATPGAGQFDVTNPSGSQARITLGTASSVNDTVEIFFIVPVQVLADGAHENENTEVTAKTIMWVLPTFASSNLSRTVATLVAPQ